MSARDFYDVLGVRKNASASDVKKAYYRLVKKLHPDLNKKDADVEQKFQEVQEAYEVLKDEQKRSVYDQVGHDAYKQASEDGGPCGSGDFGFEDIFNGGMDDIFSFFRSRRMGGEDVKVSLELSFMEAVQGCTKNVTFQATTICQSCGGSGVPPGTKPETCTRCKGSGAIYISSVPIKLQASCSQCSGSGKVVTIFCKSCHGERVVKASKSVKLDISPGVDNNQIMKIPRIGGADPDGFLSGDVYVTFRVKEDSIFRREDSDIHVDVFLTITQAILGGTIQVPTLTGDVVLKVRPGTQPSQKVVMKKKGIKTSNSRLIGNQYVHFNINIPQNFTQRQLQLIEEFAKEEQWEYDNKDSTAGAAP